MQQSLLFFACCFCTQLAAQQHPFVFYTPKDGLVNSRVRSIQQDSRGRMYFMTFGGLSVYDGARFTAYRQESGLANDFVNDIAEAGPDSILVATNTAQLNTLVRGKVGVYKTADGFCPLINRFLKTADGRWYVTSDEGLFVLEDRRFRRLPFSDNNGANLGKTLDRILEWGDYFLLMPWGNHGYSLALYHRKQQKLTDTYKGPLSSIVADKQQRLWVSGPKGLSFLDTAALKQGRLTVLPLPPALAAVKTQPHTGIFCDAENNLWFYSGNSILKLAPDLQQQVFSITEGIKTGAVTDLFRDREGSVWMATNGNGVVKLNSTRIQLLNSFPPSVPMSVTAMQQQGDTLWLFNTPNNTVYSLHRNVFKSYPLGRRMSASNIVVVGQQLYLSDAKKWVRIKNKNSAAAYHSPEVVWQVGKALHGLGAATLTRYGFIVQQIYKGDGGYTLGVFKNGRLLMEHPVSYPADQLSLYGENRLWLVTRSNRLMVFTLHPQEPQRYLRLQKELKNELPPQLHPRSLTVDHGGAVWVGTRYTGLYRLTFTHGSLSSVQQFTTKDGLTDNFIYRLHCSGDNTVWIGTQAGLDKISRKGNRYVITNVGKTHNFFQPVVQIASTVAGTVHALTSEGHLLKVEPAANAPLSALPSLLLTAVRINNAEFTGDASRLSHHQNSLSFSVAAPSFVDEKSIRYSYRLQGSGHASWSEPSNNASFNASNLSPGDYNFFAKAEFPGELYPPQQVSFRFTVLPPWWQAVWFRASLGLLLVGVLVLLVRFYYRRKLQKQKARLEKQQAIEKERTRIATDMHDDLGATLSRIKFLSEGIAFKKERGQTIDDDVVRIQSYSHQMIARMGEIVWALNEKNDSLADLLSYTRAYAVEYLAENRIDCTVEAPADVPPLFVSGEFRRNVFLSVKEALHNIVKHAAATTVRLSFTAGEELIISINDGGKGLPQQSNPSGNGLASMRSRMVAINGNMTIKSTGGTTIVFSAPLYR